MVLFLAMMAGKVMSQTQQLFQQNDRMSYTVRQGSDKPGSTDATRIIQLIADADGRSVSMTQFEVTWNQSIRVFRESPKLVVFQIDHLDIRLRDPQKVKGFDISALLIPSAVDFSYNYRASQATAASTYNAAKKITNGNAERSEQRYQDSTTRAATAAVTRLHFMYNEQAVREIKERLETIKEYYASDILLTQSYERLIRVNPQDPLMLDLQNNELLQVEKVIADVKARNFNRQLDLVLYDPINLLSRLKRLEEEAEAKRVVMNQTKANLFLFFYNNGLDLKARGRYQQAYDAFTRSVLENPLFAPALYQLALMDYEEGRYAESECRTRTILVEMVPDPDIERMARSHAGRLNDTYTQLGEERLQQGKIDEALDFLKRAANLCKSIRNVPCNEKLDDDLRQAHQAKYKQLLDQARVAYQQNNLDQAESIIQQALKYQLANVRYIPSPSEAIDMRKAVKQKRYDLLLQDARQAMTQGSTALALDQLLKARSLQVQEGLNMSENYPSMIRTAGKPAFLSKAQGAQQSARENKLNQARGQVKELIGLMDTYMLQEDEAANEALSAAQKSIFSQECTNAQKALDEFAAKAGDSYDRRKFREADQYIRAALKVSEGNQDCHLDEGNLRASLDSMRPAVTYQKMMDDVLFLQGQGRFAETYSSYQQAGNYFTVQNVAYFSLEHPDIDVFAYAQCTDEFMVYLAGTYLDRKEYDHSLTIFKNILTRNGGKTFSSMNKGLVRLGTELAVRDKLNGTAVSWKSGVLRYTNGDKRLKALEKGYRQGWKKG